MAQLTSCLLFSHQLDSWASSGAAAPPLLLTAWSPFCGLQWFRCCCRGSSAVCAGVRAHKHACDDNVNGKPRVKSALPLQSSEVERCFQGRYEHLKKIQQTLLSTSLELLGLKSLTPYWQIQLFNLPVKLIITLHWQHLLIYSWYATTSTVKYSSHFKVTFDTHKKWQAYLNDHRSSDP